MTAFTGRAVIVTGGGTGIGRAAALAFADHGDRVLITGRTEEPLVAVAKEHDAIHPYPLDLTRPDSPDELVATARRLLGGLDVLVNNAGTGTFGELDHLAVENVDAQLATNLRAPALLAQAALDALAADGGGVIVNVSSAGAAGLRAWPGNSIYGASKTALDFLTRSWAVELAPRGIRVVGVAPGVIDTGIGERIGMPPEAYAGFLTQMAERVPLGRVGEPDDVAWWIRQLCDPRAGYVTGTVVTVDGGLSLT